MTNGKLTMTFRKDLMTELLNSIKKHYIKNNWVIGEIKQLELKSFDFNININE